MKYTTASKDDDMYDYLPLRDCSFLKRRFRDHACGHIVGALDPNSLYKSMQWYLPSNVQSLEDQMVSTARSHLDEVFLHLGFDSFSRYRIALVELICSAMAQLDGVERDSSILLSMFPTYEEVSQRIFPDSRPESEG